MRRSMKVIGPLLSALAIVMLALMALMDGGAVTRTNAMRTPPACAEESISCLPSGPLEQGARL